MIAIDKPDVDEAFEWQILVIGIVSSVTIQYPEYFFTLTPGVAGPSLKAAKVLVIPLLTTIITLLIGKLAVREASRVLPRVVARVFITSMTAVNYYSYTQGLIWHSGFDLLGFMLFFLASPVLMHLVVVPKYP